MVSGVLNFISSGLTGISNLIVSGQQSKYGRLPDWLSPRDFQRKDYLMEIVLGGMALALIVILIATATIAKK